MNRVRLMSFLSLVVSFTLDLLNLPLFSRREWFHSEEIATRFLQNSVKLGVPIIILQMRKQGYKTNDLTSARASSLTQVCLVLATLLPPKLHSITWISEP